MFTRMFAATGAFLLSAGLASAEPMTLEHSQGSTALPATPEKVLVLDINALDIAAAMGAEPAGVINGNLPDYLQKFASDDYPKMGTLFEPDYEAVAASGADLMIVGARSARAFPQLSGILPTVDLSVGEDLFASVQKNITTIGQIFGQSEKAAEMVAELDAKVAHLQQVAPHAGTALILVTNGGKLGAYGPTSRVGWIHTELGFAPLEDNIDDRFHGGDVVSFEYILEKNPDWIFVVDRDAAVGSAGEGAKATLDNALMARTKAVQEDRVIYLNPHAAYVAYGGYTALNRLLDELTTALSGKS